LGETVPTLSTGQTLRRTLDHDYGAIQQHILRLGALAELQLSRAMRVVLSQDTHAAAHALHDAHSAAALRLEIERGCLLIMATQQPAARDLRGVLATMHIASELCRIAVKSTVVADLGRQMIGDRLPGSLEALHRMHETVEHMLHRAIDAYLRADAPLARHLKAFDKQLDTDYDTLLAALTEQMTADAGLVASGVRLTWVARSLERIGDRVTNICERTIFIASGALTEPETVPVPPRLTHG
jgi:phosphate transport system protein